MVKWKRYHVSLCTMFTFYDWLHLMGIWVEGKAYKSIWWCNFQLTYLGIYTRVPCPSEISFGELSFLTDHHFYGDDGCCSERVSLYITP